MIPKHHDIKDVNIGRKKEKKLTGYCAVIMIALRVQKKIRIV